MSALLIKGGVLCGESGETRADLLIENGKIAAVGLDLNADAEVFDARGLAVMPAFTDLHCHLRTPGQTHKETIDSGTAAAAAGGFTTLVAMANTTPVCSSLETAKQVADEAARLGRCDVYQCLSLTKDFNSADVSHLKALDGDYKNTVRCVSDDGRGVENGRVLLNALRVCAEKGLKAHIHAEDHAFSAEDMALAEDLETIRDLRIAEASGLPIHFCHVSTAVSAEAIVAAKRRGAAVTWEVSPHHLALNCGAEFRVNPPLRPEADRLALIRAVNEGYVDAIATDHAPHTEEEKRGGSPGLVGLETAFMVCYTTLVRNGKLPLSGLVRLMSTNPARMLGINKGSLRPGYDADIAIADLNAPVTVDSANFYSMGHSTPFHGMTFYGKIAATLKAGRFTFKNNAVI